MGNWSYNPTYRSYNPIYNWKGAHLVGICFEGSPIHLKPQGFEWVVWSRFLGACLWATSASSKKLVAWSVASSFAAFREWSWLRGVVRVVRFHLEIFGVGWPCSPGVASCLPGLVFLKKTGKITEKKRREFPISRHQPKKQTRSILYLCWKLTLVITLPTQTMHNYRGNPSKLPATFAAYFIPIKLGTLMTPVFPHFREYEPRILSTIPNRISLWCFLLPFTIRVKNGYTRIPQIIG